MLEGQALFDGAEYPVYVRLAESAGRIYLDLCDDHWRVIEIDASGWRVTVNPPIRFRRPRGVLPLPLPVGGKTLDVLWEFVNLADESARVLFVAWLLQALRPTGPYPIMVLHGEHGAAKSTAARIARRSTDPELGRVTQSPARGARPDDNGREQLDHRIRQPLKRP